jgi:D-cysteine desulfhydrase
MLNYPPRIPLAQTPTPLQPLNRLQQQLGGPRIWLKRDDLTGSTLSGNKVRKLEFIAARAQAQGYDALITCGGIQSNHCRATALLAAQMGWRCHLILRGVPEAGECANGNQLLDELSGCSISYHPPREYFSQHAQLFETAAQDLIKAGHKPLSIPTGGSDGHGIWGYIAACDELKTDFAEHGIDPRAIVTATGSGGTQAGLTVGVGLCEINAAVYGVAVCDDEQYFKAKVSADIRDWEQKYPGQSRGLIVDDQVLLERIHVIDGYVGEGYGIASDEVIDTIRLVASTEGVVLDPVYSGKAFNGLLKEIAGGRFNDQRDIVFIHTGGVFGVFAYREQFAGRN